ncbi:TetR-like C-terminal domain-containing protein, partial [Lactococcus lactis]
TTYYANAIFGTTQSWIRRKQKETPTQIANLLVELIN